MTPIAAVASASLVLAVSSLLGSWVLLCSCASALHHSKAIGVDRGDSSPYHTHQPFAWPHRAVRADRSPRQLGPSIGAVRALVVMIRFPEHSQRQLPTPEVVKAVCEGPVASYMSQQSYGQFTISGCDVSDWVEADNTEEFYSYNKYGRISNAELQPILHPALILLDETAKASNPNFWQQYDSDGDRAIDVVIGVHSGYGSEFSMNDCETGREPFQRIQSQAWNEMVDAGWVSSQETGLFALQGYTIIPALELACGNTTVKPGKMAHELTHTLMGWPPDLYDLSVGGAGVGGYDIMSSAYGPSGKNGDAPGSMSPWMKQLLTWSVPEEIVADGTYTMRPSTLYPDYYVIRGGFPDQEYLLLEYRTNATGGFDADFYGAGMVIYHVDDTVDLNRNIGYPGYNGWPSNGPYYMLSVLQADGNYDIEKKVNIGDAGDLWTAGMSIGPGSGGKFPNTDSIQGGVVASTGLTITVLSVDSSALTFTVSGMTPAAPVASPVSSAGPTTIVNVPYPGGSSATNMPSAVLVTISGPTSAAPASSAPITATPVAAPVASSPTVAPVASSPTVAPVAAASTAASDPPSAKPISPTASLGDGGENDNAFNATHNGTAGTSGVTRGGTHKLLVFIMASTVYFTMMSWKS